MAEHAWPPTFPGQQALLEGGHGVAVDRQRLAGFQRVGGIIGRHEHVPGGRHHAQPLGVQEAVQHMAHILPDAPVAVLVLRHKSAPPRKGNGKPLDPKGN
jgi:hypothetical protein